VDCGCTSPTAFATYDPVTSTWRTSPRSARAASRKSSPTQPRSGMTRSGRACALPTLEPRTAATAYSSSSVAVRPGEAGRLAAAADPGRRELRRRGSGACRMAPRRPTAAPGTRSAVRSCPGPTTAGASTRGARPRRCGGARRVTASVPSRSRPLRAGRRRRSRRPCPGRRPHAGAGPRRALPGPSGRPW
jgi:hypothetical protein